MKRTILISICFIFAIVKTNKLLAQTTYTLDYTTLSVRNQGPLFCNIFGVPTTVNGFLHRSSIGNIPANYDEYGSVTSITLPSYAWNRYFDCPGNIDGICQVNIDNPGYRIDMTQYSVAFPFKVGHEYKISILGKGSPIYGSDIGLALSETNGGESDPAEYYNPCPAQPFNATKDSSIRAQYSLTTISNYTTNEWVQVFDHIATQDFNFLLIAGLPIRTYYSMHFNLYIQKIQIIESLPMADCTIDPLVNQGIISGDLTGGTVTVNSRTGTGGTGDIPVTVNPNGGAWLVAKNSIFFKSEFRVQSPTTGNFGAIIAPCKPSPPLRTLFDYDTSYPQAKKINNPINDNEVKIYPTPSTGMFNISLGGLDLSKIVTISVYNQLGKVLNKSTYLKLKNNVIQMNLQKLSNGIYFLKICTSETRITKKIIISK